MEEILTVAHRMWADGELTDAQVISVGCATLDNDDELEDFLDHVQELSELHSAG